MSTERPRILVVDDDEVDCEAVRRMAGDEFEVLEALTASQAETLLRGDPMACVLVDYRLGEVDGLAFLSRCSQEYLQSAFILVTGHGDETIAVEAMKGGAQDYLVKETLTPSTLSDAIRTAIRRRRTEQSLGQHAEHFRQLTEQTQRVLWVAAADGSFVEYVSLSYETVWGGVCQDLYDDARDWLRSVREGDRERVTKTFLADVMEGNVEAVYEIDHPDGSVHVVCDRGFPIRDEDGRIRRIARFVQDITDLRTSETKVLEALAASPAPAGGQIVLEIPVSGLRAGMIFAQDVIAANGLQLVKQGHQATEGLRKRIQNFAQGIGVSEPLHVIPASLAPTASRDAVPGPRPDQR